MLATGFPERIGFQEEECALYRAFNARAGAEIEPYAKAYMQGEMSMQDALEQIHGMANESLHVYTLDLLFVMACTGYLEVQYQEKGIAEEIFVNTMRDIHYKLDECRRVKGVFGTFVAEWYDVFFRGEAMGLGRLQYRKLAYGGEPLSICGIEIKEGDVTLDCHIPSSGPLTRELCLASYRLAYEAFPEMRIGGVLPIACSSWLLYPETKEVFSASPNTAAFINDFEIFASKTQEEFHDAWRVFGAYAGAALEKLPEKTSLQRAFKAHMKEGGSFGYGMGLILFDGEKVLTAQSCK